MVQKCKNCGAKIVKFPLFEGEAFKSKFIWINLFKMDWYSIILFVIIITLVVSYKADIATCRELSDKIERDPCVFCDKLSPYGSIADIDLGLDIIDINNTS